MTQPAKDIPSYKPVLFLIIVPSIITALAVFTLYVILMPNFPVIHQYYFPQSVRTYQVYNVPIYGHIIFGTVALLLGPINLYLGLRRTNFRLHRKIGKTYAVAVTVSAVCALFMSFHAYAGTLAHGRLVVTSGFATLACLWLFTLYRAIYQIAYRHDENKHFFWMIVNISLIYSAFILRIWIGVITAINKFDVLYPLLGWIGWVPSLIVGYILAKRRYDRVTAA